MIGKIILFGSCLFFAGCTVMGLEPLFTTEDEGRFLLSADAAGMEAFSDALSGLVTTGKASPNVEDHYWASRKEAVKFKLLRRSAVKEAK